MTPPRETFTSRLGVLATMVGVAVGLGNVWRFPYMVGRYGGGAFVLLYVALAILVGVPALMAEWSLGRHTRQGTLRAFRDAGLPGGRALGWILTGVVLAALGYYNNAIGWVVFHGVSEAAAPLGRPLHGADILPPAEGFTPRSFALQVGFTALILVVQGAVLLKGLRQGIQRASTVLTPILFATLVLLILRALTLPGSGEGVRWLLAFHPGDVSPAVAMAALGQVVFSLALGGTFMVTYGSYLPDGADIRADAALTVAGDTLAGLLAGLALFPAVFALGLEPGSGPGLLFETLPLLFDRMPGGWLWGTLFYGALGGAALLSGLAALEVLVEGVCGATGWSRRKGIVVLGSGAFLLALPPMVNLEVFIPWDLTFGSGGQTFGAVAAMVTAGWALRRGALLAQLGGDAPSRLDRALVWWIRWVIPVAVGVAAVWWFLADVMGAVQAV